MKTETDAAVASAIIPENGKFAIETSVHAPRAIASRANEPNRTDVGRRYCFVAGCFIVVVARVPKKAHEGRDPR